MQKDILDVIDSLYYRFYRHTSGLGDSNLLRSIIKSYRRVYIDNDIIQGVLDDIEEALVGKKESSRSIDLLEGAIDKYTEQEQKLGMFNVPEQRVVDLTKIRLSNKDITLINDILGLSKVITLDQLEKAYQSNKHKNKAHELYREIKWKYFTDKSSLSASTISEIEKEIDTKRVQRNV